LALAEQLEREEHSESNNCNTAPCREQDLAEEKTQNDAGDPPLTIRLAMPQ
jgi:hypothetical protein